MDHTVLPAIHPRVYTRMEWTTRPAFAFSAKAVPHLPTPEGWNAELTNNRNNALDGWIDWQLVISYVEGSRRWADLCIFRASWHHTPYSGHLVLPDPTADPHTRSSKSAMTRSRWRSCVASLKRSGRWAPVTSSCRRAVSVARIEAGDLPQTCCLCSLPHDCVWK